MNREVIIFICLLFSISIDVNAQPMPKGILYFDQLLEYQFIDVDGTKSDMQILLNSKTGMLGFEKNGTDATGWGDDLQFIVSDSIGNFYFYGVDPEKGKIFFKQLLKEAKPSVKDLERFRKTFATQFVSIGKNQKSDGLLVQQYRTKPDFEGAYEKLSFTKVHFNTYPLYLFNTLGGDAKLPCGDRLDFTSILAPNQLLVESILMFPKEKLSSTLKLTYYTPTTYYFDTKGYKPLLKSK